jgi:hypothetical protein
MRRTLRVVLQKSAIAFDVPVSPQGYCAKLQNRALPTLVVMLRSLSCSFAGSAAERIWNLRSSQVFVKRDHQIVEKPGLRTDGSLPFVMPDRFVSSLLGLRGQASTHH